MTDDSVRFRPGVYKHYKGGEYDVLTLATHSESLDKLVVYRARYGARNIWVRPVEMFFENVEYCGVEVERFSYLREFDSNSDNSL